MSGIFKVVARVLLLASVVTTESCRSAPMAPGHPASATSLTRPLSSPTAAADDPRSPRHADDVEDEVEPVSHQQPEDEPVGPVDSLIDRQNSLSLDWVVAEVLRRNPNRQAALAAWQAAAKRYPQEVALDDPMLQTMIGPRGLASNQVEGAYMVGVAQKVPWQGKRELRGEKALWELTAAQWDSADVDLRLTEAAKLAYFEYYLATRKLEVNTQSAEKLGAFRDTARSKYEANQVTQQDVLQTDVELGQLNKSRIELVREQQIAIARINTLLHQLPQTPLPPPIESLETDGGVLPVGALQDLLVHHRPDLTAMSARIQAERTSIESACKEFYPDFEFMARYDAFWQEKPLRPMLGMNVNIPVNQAKRHAAVDEAIFRYNKMCAEYTAAVDSARNDVQAAYERLDASRKVVALYRETILPAAEANIAAAEAGYTAGTVDFLRLVEAQRQLIDLREQQYEAVAEFHSRRAELERLVGQPVGDSTFN